MKLTRRGWVVLGLIGFCLLMAAEYGSRSLNAVVAPLAIVFVGALVTAYRTKRPRFQRHPVEEGYPGDRRTVELGVDVGAATTATVRDRLPEGATAVDSGNVMETTLIDGETLSYEIELEVRGKHALGPVSVTVTDIFGLVSRQFRYDQTGSVVVYPSVYDLRGGAKHDLQLLEDAIRAYDREEFDHLREYERGDSLRDIHWKSAAKRPNDELVVKEFAADGSVGSATLAGECIPGKDDEMAMAMASVATYLLRQEVSVGLTISEGTLEAETGERHHVELLRALALAGDGEVDGRTRQKADVLIQADAAGIFVIAGEHEIPFDRLRGVGTTRSKDAVTDDSATQSSTSSAGAVADGGQTSHHPEHGHDGGKTSSSEVRSA
ncbi:DUF58 domain-containing protein [Halobacteria archaeon AArc-curdl1]|uniref:DUF58 domain-containing protein n=1 Tax=Natronosalvus hydrolyticus TaxID=2979988 RepID=A0AAP2Z649_9EURY|nr:DUF58 domain-containing protein [Halobacteria archaeon AArc-curdl1]